MIDITICLSLSYTHTNLACCVKHVYETVCLSFLRFLSPEFIPPRQRTDPFTFVIERKDMIRRRKVLSIPEFYVGKKPIQTLSRHIPTEM